MSPRDLHEWVSFEDPEEDRTWVFDATWLLSNWMCIYGNGCPGISEEPAADAAIGCCEHGAWFSDDGDRDRVMRYTERLTAKQWQHKPIADTKGALAKQKKDSGRTRVVDGGCVFLNRPGFDGGPGCALHRAALEAGDNPLEWKPEVCWQLPIRRIDTTEEDGHVVSSVREWKRRDWGEGGHDFHWWCTTEPGAYVGSDAVYITSKAELVAMVGQRVYDLLAEQLDARRPTAVEHPVVIASRARQSL